MFQEQVKRDSEIKENLKKLDSFGRVRLVACLADLQVVLKRMEEQDIDAIRENLNKLTSEEQMLAFQIWLNNFLERNRFGDIIKME